MFTRRHYVAIAGAFEEVYQMRLNHEKEDVAFMIMLQAMSKMFAADNSRFDDHRFRKAAYGGRDN